MYMLLTFAREKIKVKHLFMGGLGFLVLFFVATLSMPSFSDVIPGVPDVVPEVEVSDRVYNSIDVTELTSEGLFCGGQAEGRVTFEIDSNHSIKGIEIPGLISGETASIVATGDMHACVSMDKSGFVFNQAHNSLVAYLHRPEASRPRINMENIQIESSEGYFQKVEDLWNRDDDLLESVLFESQVLLEEKLTDQTVGIATVKTEEFIKSFAATNGVETVIIHWVKPETAPTSVIDSNLRGES